MGLGHGAGIVRSGLVLHLDAANRKSYPGTGTIWNDISGNNNNGTLVNGVGYNSTNNGSLTFDGTNDYVTIDNSSSVNITGQNITLEVTYKNNDLASALHGDGLISKGSGGNDGQYEILIVPLNSKNYAFFRCVGLGVYSPQTIPMDVGIVYHVTCVLQSRYMTIYVNGVLDGPGELKTADIPSRTQPLIIGSRQLQLGTSESKVNGNIYSTRVYNRALSAAEVRQNFDAIRGRYGI
jgi:hypothetical protein